MTDRVAAYVAVERELLTHRLRGLLSGAVADGDDPEEDRAEAEFDRLWKEMTAGERAELDRACDRRTSAWLEPAVSRDAGRSSGAYVLWLRALADAVEVSLPRSTRSRLAPSAGRAGRLLLGWDLLGAVPGGAVRALIDAALLLVGRTEDEVRDAGGLDFRDPDTRERLLQQAVEPSRVSETQPEPPLA